MTPRLRIALTSGAAIATVLVAMFVIGDGVGGRSPGDGGDYDLISTDTVTALAADGVQVTDIDGERIGGAEAGRAVEIALAQERESSLSGLTTTVALASVTVEDRDDITRRRLWVVALTPDPDPVDEAPAPSVVLVDPDTLVAVYSR